MAVKNVITPFYTSCDQLQMLQVMKGIKTLAKAWILIIKERNTMWPIYLQIQKQLRKVISSYILDTSTGTPLIREEVADLLKFDGIKRKLNIKSAAWEVVNFSMISENDEKNQFNKEPAPVMKVLNMPQMKIQEVIKEKYDHCVIYHLPNKKKVTEGWYSTAMQS